MNYDPLLFIFLILNICSISFCRFRLLWASSTFSFFISFELFLICSCFLSIFFIPGNIRFEIHDLLVYSQLMLQRRSSTRPRDLLSSLSFALYSLNRRFPVRFGLLHSALQGGLPLQAGFQSNSESVSTLLFSLLGIVL